MLKKPFFSIVIPLFNKEDYIENTLQSVINQTFQDFEIIIVNDGSNDKSYDIVKNITNSKIQIYSNENRGLSYSRNFGIKKANADFIALLDADDLWTKDYLECISSFINQHDDKYIFATNNNTWFHKESPSLNIKNTSNCEHELIEDYFSFGKNIFSYSSIVFHKSVFDTIGYFNEHVNHGEEEEFSIKCFLKYDLIYTKRKKVFYLKNVKNQLSEPNKKKMRVLPNYDNYLINNKNKNLKKYIDFVHFKLVVLYKMERNYELVFFYKEKIDKNNLSIIKKIKYHLPTSIFYYLKSFSIWFSNRFIHS